MDKTKHTLIKIKNGFVVLFFVLLSFAFDSQNNYLNKAKLFYVIDSNIYYGEKHLVECLNNSKDSRIIIDAYNYVISNYLNKGKNTKARKLVQEMRELSLKLNDKEMDYVAIGLLGDVEKYSKNYSKAVNYYLRSYDLLEKNKNWDYLCKCSIDMIELNRSIANYKDAEVYIKKTFNIFYSHNLKDSTILARLYNRIAAVKNETGTLKLIDSSIVYSKKSLLINQKLKNLNGQAITWNELGYSFRHLKKIDTAEVCFKKAEDIWFSIGADNAMVNAMNNRAALYGYFNIKNNERIALYFKVLKIIEQKKLDYDVYLVYNGLSEEYLRQNDLKKAHKYYKLYHEAYTKKLEKIYSAQIDDIKEKYESKKNKEEVKQMSGKLSASEKTLHQINKENKLIYLVLSLFIVLVIVIIFLLYRESKNNLLLKIKNREKDALIQEVHHRVKNNLQLIAAMLKMQINSIKDESNQAVLKETSRRINSMSLVHEMLYNKDQTDFVSLKEYVSELVTKLKELVYNFNKPITFKIEVEDVKFNINDCVAIGMITSEIISNAIKYAFSEIQEPIITLTLKCRKNENIIIYTLGDNGKGFTDKGTGLGLRLIDIFSRQLEAEYESKNENGLKYTFTIPYEKNEK